MNYINQSRDSDKHIIFDTYYRMKNKDLVMETVGDLLSLKIQIHFQTDMFKLGLLLVLLNVEMKDFLMFMPEWTILIYGISSMTIFKSIPKSQLQLQPILQQAPPLQKQLLQPQPQPPLP